MAKYVFAFSRFSLVLSGLEIVDEEEPALNTVCGNTRKKLNTEKTRTIVIEFRLLAELVMMEFSFE